MIGVVLIGLGVGVTLSRRRHGDGYLLQCCCRGQDQIVVAVVVGAGGKFRQVTQFTRLSGQIQNRYVYIPRSTFRIIKKDAHRLERIITLEAGAT